MITIDRLKTLILAAVFIAILGTAHAKGKVINIGNFEKDKDGWIFITGPSAHGNLVRDDAESKEGGYSAWMEAVLNGNRAYVGMRKLLKKTVKVSEVRFWIKANGVNEISFQIVGADKQTHQHHIRLKETSDWQQVIIKNFTPKDKKYGFWGGKKDGVWRNPTRKIALLINKWALKDKKGKIGSIWIDNIEIVSN